MKQLKYKKWLIISHAFNMDGRAASLTITDKIPHLMNAGVEPYVISAITGNKDDRFVHFQVWAAAPSGVKFDLRHWLKNKYYQKSVSYKLIKAITSIAIAPFYLIERSLVHLESQWSWYFNAYRKALKLIHSEEIELIYTSGGANSAHYAGYLLKKKTGLPWIVEIHDPMIHEEWENSKMAYRWASSLESKICQNADAVWWFTEKAHERAKARNPSLSDRGHCINPGVGIPDFGAIEYVKREHCHFGHFGSLADTRSLAFVIKALSLLTNEYPEYADKVKLDVYGSDLDSVSAKAADTHPLPKGMLNVLGRLDHDSATGKSGRQRVLEAMRASDVLILLHGNSSFCEEYIPSKLYEYLHTRRPILGFHYNNPELQAKLKGSGHIALDSEDVSATVDAIKRIVDQWSQKGLPDCPAKSPYVVDKAVERILKISEGIKG